MFVMSAFLGDNCYMGYVFPPEIRHAKLEKKIWELACANPQVDFIFKPPLRERYPQLQSPVLDIIGENPRSWISVQDNTPLSRLLDAADIFVVDCPSTPVTDIAPTDRVMVLYVDKEDYRLAPHAEEPLRRRTVFSDNEEDFLKSLASVLQAPEEFIRAPVDQTFTREFLTGGKEEGCPQMIVDFLESILPHTRRNEHG
jgi:hypothetical protein